MLKRLLPVVLLFLTACSDTELVGMYISLTEDGSGTLTARSLQPATVPSPAEAKARGIQWQARATLSSSQGTFRSLSDVAFGDGEVRFLVTNEEMPQLRVVLKRGRELAWVQSLVPDQEMRRQLAVVHDPTGKTKEVADTIRIDVELPDAVVASGVQPAGRGIEASHERKRAYLLLPVEGLLEPGEDLIWVVSWK